MLIVLSRCSNSIPNGGGQTFRIILCGFGSAVCIPKKVDKAEA